MKMKIKKSWITYDKIQRGKSILAFISMDWLICTMKLSRTFLVGVGVTVLSTLLVISKIQSFDHKMSIFIWLPAKAIATMRAEKEVMPL